MSADPMLGWVRGAADQLEAALRAPAPRLEGPRPRRILVLGTGGGSAMAGEFLKRLLDRPGLVPADVSGEYAPPAWAGRGTLVLAASHSGNTKETLSAVQAAARRGAAVAALTAGGRLLELARRRRWPVWPLTPGPMPRALLYGILAGMLRLLGSAGLYPRPEAELRAAASLLAAGRAARERAARAAARRLLGKVPCLYGAEPATAAAAVRLRNQLAENAKVLSLAASLPRAHHDEIVGWGQPRELSRRFACVLLRDAREGAETARRFEATARLLRPRAGAVCELKAQGRLLLERMLSLSHACDLVSVHLALLRGVAPTPVPVIDEMKAAMGQGR